MTDLEREIHLLISIAKVDAKINEYKNELSLLPGKIAEEAKAIDKITQSEQEATERFEGVKREHRQLEQQVEDHQAQIIKYKKQQMGIKNNDEYLAMTKQIKTLEEEIDAKEERLLVLMDEQETQAENHQAFLAKAAGDKKEREQKKKEMEDRAEFLKTELVNLDNEKPKFLSELEPQMQRRYQRIIGKLGDYAVTRVIDEVCQGCFATIPPQRYNEVRKNDRIITCEGCGRILVYYTT